MVILNLISSPNYIFEPQNTLTNCSDTVSQKRLSVLTTMVFFFFTCPHKYRYFRNRHTQKQSKWDSVCWKHEAGGQQRCGHTGSSWVWPQPECLHVFTPESSSCSVITEQTGRRKEEKKRKKWKNQGTRALLFASCVHFTVVKKIHLFWNVSYWCKVIAIYYGHFKIFLIILIVVIVNHSYVNLNEFSCFSFVLI